MNLKNIEITKLDDKEIEAKAYFPYHINRLLLQYCVIEMEKIEQVKHCSIVLKKEELDQGPHES